METPKTKTESEKMLEKVAQDVPTQPLKTRKSNVWSRRNTSFQLSNVALK